MSRYLDRLPLDARFHFQRFAGFRPSSSNDAEDALIELARRLPKMGADDSLKLMVEAFGELEVLEASQIIHEIQSDLDSATEIAGEPNPINEFLQQHAVAHLSGASLTTETTERRLTVIVSGIPFSAPLPDGHDARVMEFAISEIIKTADHAAMTEWLECAICAAAREKAITRVVLKDVTVLPVANGDGTYRIETRENGNLTEVIPRVRLNPHDVALVAAGVTEGFIGDFEIIEDGQ